MEQVTAETSFEFAFNNAKFSDRTLQVEIILASNPEDAIGNLGDGALSPDKKRPRFDKSDDSIDNLGYCAPCLDQSNDAIDNLGDCAPNSKRPRLDQDVNIHVVVHNNENPSSTKASIEARVKIIYINAMLLAARSPFFYKLFTNGMSESSKKHVTLQIQESEEDAFMDLLKFMYTNTLASTSPPAIVDVLILADKYEVVSCMQHCYQLLSKLPMTCELAVLYLDLISAPLMSDTVKARSDVAKEFLVARFKDITKFHEEMLDLPIVGIEAVLSNDDLQVSSEDEIYDFVMKWARRHFTKPGERQEVLSNRLLDLIRFPFMSHNKLQEVLTCTDIDLEHRSKLVFDAISLETPHRELPPVTKHERAYKLRPVKVTRFDSPREECVVYFNLKHQECAALLPSGNIRSRPFDLDGEAFYLEGLIEERCFSLCLGMQGERSEGLMVEYEFFCRKKPTEKFVSLGELEHNFTRARCGFKNVFEMAWTKCIADDSPYIINGVLHLKAVIKIKK